MTAQIASRSVSILQRMAQQSARKPDSSAITFLPDGDISHTLTRSYSQLHAQAQRVASALLEVIHPGDRALLLLAPGPDYFAAVWGCLLAGVVAVPVAVPKMEAQFIFSRNIIDDCGAALVLVDEGNCDQLQSGLGGGSQPLKWLTLEQAIATEPRELLNPPADSDPALLQYTSGSTGMPKGVVVTHGNLAASVDLMLSVADIDAASTVVSWLPLFHNMGFISFGLLPLCVGAHVVLMSTEHFMLNPARWYLAISHFRGTHSGAPNIGYETCLNFLPDALLDKLDLSSWRVAAIGSEPLKANLIQGFCQRFGRCGFRAETFLTTYGFSEATVFSAGSDFRAAVPMLDVDKPAFEDGRIEPVSRVSKTLVSVGAAGDHIAIVNPDSMAVCGDRELGEIWIRGATVAAGYWQKPDVSAQTFDIYADDGSGPYVRSGDLGMIADGNLYVVGRRKELIIVSGKKLHPLDIEQSVNGLAESFVPYATAAAAWQTDDGEFLAVFQELKPDASPEQFEGLVTGLCDRVFERFGVNVERVVLLAMGSLPRTHNGKLQRLRCCSEVDSGQLAPKVLLDWRARAPQAGQDTMSPVAAPAVPAEAQTVTEKALQAVWQAMLNRPVIAVDADFVSLGGQSIIATRIIAQVREQFAVDVSIRTLFRFPTIRKLAAHIDGLPRIENLGRNPVPPAVLDDESDQWQPLTSAQKRLWLLSRMEESAAYHMCASFRIDGDLQVEALRQALAALVRRHRILHTVYRPDADAVALQKPLADPLFDIDYQDLASQSADPDRQRERIEHLLQVSRTRPFDLQHDPMLRACLIRTEPDSHLLCLTLHHIAADGWSVGILVRELETLYRAGVENREAGFDQPARQYAPWVLWREANLDQGREQASLEYWVQQLQDSPPMHSLPLDRPRIGGSRYQGESHYTKISAERVRELDQSGRGRGVTLYMQLQAALAILMARLSNQQDIAIGAAYANRTEAECENMVGFFVNSLVIRHRMLLDCPITGILEQSRDTVLDAYEHDLPFERLVEVLNPYRSGNANPLFQVMLNLQDKDNWDLRLSGLQVTPFQVSTQEAKFDLAVDCTLSTAGLSIQWEFDSTLFQRTTIARWAGYFERILQAMVQEPDLSWERIPLLDDAERRCLLQDWNATGQPRHDVCIHNLFERQVEARPQAMALVCDDETFTYRHVNEQANRLAHALLARGVQADDRVAVIVERSAQSVIAMLAVLKAGAAYVPVDPHYPARRIAFIIADAAPRAIIASIEFPLPEQVQPGCPVLPPQPEGDYSTENPAQVSVTPKHLAYVIYTSGSTGQPKGAMLEHRQVANLVCNPGEIAVSYRDRVAHCANPAFDAATWEIWSALTRGACLVVVPPRIVLEPAAFRDHLLAGGVSAMVMTVAMFNHYRDVLAPVLAQLRYCLIGGEAVDVHAAMETLRRSPPRLLVNIYGPTETTVFVATQEIRPQTQEAGAVPIGRPVANTQIHILDRLDQPVPVGVTGEICVAGAQVGRGYWNRPELNARCFVNNPFTAETGNENSRLYRTGDLGRWRSDGVLEFVGRNDAQVKIRGFRVEPGEIGNALKARSDVRDAVVLPRRGADGDVRLFAYIVPVTAGTVAADWTAILAADLKQQVPDYMVPAEWMVLAALPLTAHGKLDYAALPLPDGGDTRKVAFEAPEGEQEVVLARAWQTLLGVESVSRRDNFFALGGHSLLAARLSECLREQGYGLAVRVVFQAGSLAEMAACIHAAKTTPVVIPENRIETDTARITPDLLPLLATISQDDIDAIVSQVPGGVRNVQDMTPLSPLQEGILFHHLMLQEQDPYLLRSVLAFESRERLDGFLQALREVISRHDILRTGIFWEGLAQPVQVVHRFVPLPLAEQDGMAMSQPQLLTAMEQQRQAFDVKSAPLMSATIVREDGSPRWLLGLLAHHLIADNQTLELAFAEILLLLNGEGGQLPEPVPFRRYLGEVLQESRQHHEAFFRTMLEDFQQPAFMFDEQRAGVDRSELRTADCDIGAGLTQRIRRQARRLHVTVASLVHLAWGRVISACSGSDDLVFGTVLSGRLQSGAESVRTLGLFINTLPVRLQLENSNVGDAAQAMHTRLNALTDHERAPLALAKRCSGVAAEAPLFNVLLNYRHRPGREQQQVTAALRGQGVEIRHMEEQTHYPVTLCADECDDDIHFQLQTAVTIDPEAVLEQLVTVLQQLDRALADDTAVPVLSLPVFSEQQSQQLLKQFNPSRTVPATPQLLHLQFEQQASRQPQAVALVFNDRQLTYAELNARANGIAHRLLALGVKPDDRVAVYLPRGFDLIAALIGILKAGAAYVPLDPSHPLSRLSFSLQDSEPSVLVTDSDLVHGLGAPACALLLVDEEAGPVAANPVIPSLRADHLAYVIYTSGSTGQPKGVMVEHCQAAQLFAATERQFAFDENDVWTLFHSCAFDFSVWEMWGALTTGARLVVVPADVCRAGDEFYRLLCQHRVTVLNQTPGALRALLSAQAGSAGDHRLRYVILGGEALEKHVLETWQQAFSGMPTRLINMFGITEITVHGTFADLTEWTPQGQCGLIGVPLPDTAIYVLDSRMQPVPVGVTGELYVGGAQVARGYWCRPELTAERFLADPFHDDSPGRLYRTGDLGRWHRDGTLSYCGRNDAQVKIRGYRIELGEIESRLRRLPGVHEALVRAVGYGWERRLVAYVVPVAANDWNPDALRSQLGHELPDYMLPAAWVELESLPLTANGKIDERALPAPVARSASSHYEAPQGDTEMRLALLWQSLLERAELPGRHDHFFALGGHSLLAVQVHNGISREWGINLPLRTVFELETIAKLGAVIQMFHTEMESVTEEDEFEEGVFD